MQNAGPKTQPGSTSLTMMPKPIGKAYTLTPNSKELLKFTTSGMT